MSQGGIGLTGALALVFITLKLTGVIDWSWWWVLAPLWAPLALTIVVMVVFGSVAWFGNRASTWRISDDEDS